MNGSLPRYRIHGLTIATAVPLKLPLPPSSAPVDVTVRRLEEPVFNDWEDIPPAFVSPVRLSDGESAVLLFRRPEVDLLRCTRVADFYVWEDRIDCMPLNPAREFAMEIFLLGGALAYWLERRGSLVLHASAVAIAERAVAFPAMNQTGKTSLAASLMRLDHPLISDDLLRLEFESGAIVAHPGHPQMRMWPEVAAHFVGNCERFDRVNPEISKRRIPVGGEGFGRFCDGPRSLGSVYLPMRRRPGDPSKDIEIRPVRPGEALIELVRCSFLPGISHAAGFQTRRVQHLARLVREVPVRGLLYPHGLTDLARVSEAVLADVGDSGPSRGGH